MTITYYIIQNANCKFQKIKKCNRKKIKEKNEVEILKMSSIVLNENQNEKDMIKNVMMFFHESVSHFKRELTEISVSINNFLKSLEIIEDQLGLQYDYPENSSDLLYERLTKGKEERVVQQKDLIQKLTKKVETLTQKPVVTQKPEIKTEPEKIPVKKDIPIKAVQEKPDELVELDTKQVEFITKLRQAPPKVEEEVKIKIPPLIKEEKIKSLDEFSKDTVVTENLKKEMLRRLKELTKIMKDQ